MSRPLLLRWHGLQGSGTRRGYTIVELLMSISVLAIGVSGVIAMQRVTLATSRQAKNLAIATRVAEAWADELTTDGTLWTTDSNSVSTRNTTTWLKDATAGSVGTWSVPAFSTRLGFGPAFGALGQPKDPAVNPDLTHFCTHIRLAFVQGETLPTLGNGVIRAQVRVFWRREDQAADMPTGDLCAVDGATLTANVGAFHMVYLTTSVRQLPQGRLP